jgi:hypothetical protein
MLIYLDNCCLQRPFDDRSQQRIRVEAEAMRPLDALHLASAVEGGAHYFSTSDDRLLRTANRLDLGQTEAVSLLHLIEEVSHGRAG